MWAIADLDVEIGLLFRQMGPLCDGLESIQNVGPRLAEVVEALIQWWIQVPSARFAVEPL